MILLNSIYSSVICALATSEGNDSDEECSYTNTKTISAKWKKQPVGSFEVHFDGIPFQLVAVRKITPNPITEPVRAQNLPENQVGEHRL